MGTDKAIWVLLDWSNRQDYREGLQDLRKTCRKLLERTDFFVPLEDPMWKRIQTLVRSRQVYIGWKDWRFLLRFPLSPRIKGIPCFFLRNTSTSHDVLLFLDLPLSVLASAGSEPVGLKHAAGVWLPRSILFKESLPLWIGSRIHTLLRNHCKALTLELMDANTFTVAFAPCARAAKSWYFLSASYFHWEACFQSEG